MFHDLRRHVRYVSGIKKEVSLKNYNIKFIWLALLLKAAKFNGSLLFIAYAYYIYCVRKYKEKEQIKL